MEGDSSDTGLNSMTGGRVKHAQEFIKDETFMLTYGMEFVT